VSKVQLQSAKVIDCKLRRLYRSFTSVQMQIYNVCSVKLSLESIPD
jgi:hypothetical protein